MSKAETLDYFVDTEARKTEEVRVSQVETLNYFVNGRPAGRLRKSTMT